MCDMHNVRRVVIVFCLSLGLSLAASAETGVTESKILIGSSNALTGSASWRGTQLNEGALLFFNRLNESGGVNGRKVQLDSLDDAYDPKKAFENVKKLVLQDKVFSVFQVYGTPGAKAIMPMIEKEDVPFFAPLSGADIFRVPVNRNIFSVRSQLDEETTEITRYLVETKKLTKIGILYQDDSFGASTKGAMQRSLLKHGLRVKGEGVYARNSPEEMEKALAELKKEEPEAVVILAVAKPAVAFLKLAIQKEFKPVFAAISSADDEEFAAETKASKVSIAITTSNPYLTAGNTEFFKQYAKDMKSAGKKVNSLSFEGYLNAAIFAKGLQMAGKNLTRQALRTALESLNEADLLGIKLHFSATHHQALAGSQVVKLENGEYRTF